MPIGRGVLNSTFCSKMRLKSISASNFRNLKGDIAFSDGLNVLFGANGEGKTNWLEAIDLLATTRSFRTSKLSEAVNFGERLAIVSGQVADSPEVTRKLQVAIDGNSKILTINDKKETAARYLGHLFAVRFTADELEIVRATPEARRRFLDAGITGLHPPFVQVAADYTRVIRQKNALLQSARDEGWTLERTAEALEPWNEQLVRLAAHIHRARMRFVERLNEVLERRLFGREEVAIRYVSSLEGKGDLSAYADLIRERLKLRVQAELVAGHTLIGTHRDDLEITFDGHDLRKFGSAGQQRSALLILLLAEVAVFEATRGEYPLFLIDDIDAELDYKRIANLLEFLDGKTQTIVTTSKESFVERFGAGGRVFSISNGAAKSQ
ncbi:MAG: DNA replication and repair protein RecF [Acidobacteria bacterium ACB1]|nr:DNA replication and repair protein RecF [Pyrinomonadaceae bacterium]MCE7961208.1 DNA replication and repair protein RecF [Acidobacteria bacterium ACB1]